MISYKKVGPSAYKVAHLGRVSIIQKTGDDTRGKRWRLDVTDTDIKHFRSRRAAFYFFEYGKRFDTNPVIEKHGRGKGTRIR